MSNRFIDWYNRELEALRKRASQFAKQYPKVAGRLRLTSDAIDDPHVERLMQGVAYTAARIRQKLDDDFPELTGALLETLYPHYLAPIPSMSIVQFNPTSKTDENELIQPGFLIDTEMVEGDFCRYRTTQKIELLPVHITDSTLMSPPFVAPPAVHLNALGCLGITIEGFKPDAREDQFSDALDFFIKPPFTKAANIYELLLNHTVDIAIARHPEDKAAVFLGRNSLEAMGFSEQETLLPKQLRQFPGFRLLSEFFALPEKYLFFKLKNLKAKAARANFQYGEKMHLFFYLDTHPGKLQKTVDQTSFALHCTPIVNLFPQKAEPITVTNTQTEYDLLPDSRRNATREIHSIEKVTLTNQNGEKSDVLPFFGKTQSLHKSEGRYFWQHKRQSTKIEGDGFSSRLSFVDKDLHPIAPALQSVLSIDTLCLNRNLPEKLPFGGGQPYLRPADKQSDLRTITCLFPPTATAQFSPEEGSYWRLISHLSLNHMAFGAEGAAVLKDTLRLYDFRQSAETSIMIEAISTMQSRRGSCRLKDGTVAYGLDIVIEFNDTLIDRGLAFLFGSVLSRYFAFHASMNTFTRLTVRLSGRSLPLAIFPPMTAEDIL